MTRYLPTQPFVAQSRPEYGQSAFEDPAFEPNASFIFDESEADDFNDLAHDTAAFTFPEFGAHHDLDRLRDLNGGDSGNTDSSQAQLASKFAFQTAQPGSKSSRVYLGQAGRVPSMQDHILAERGNTVVQQFGIVTPPVEKQGEDSPLAPTPAVAYPSVLESTSAQSERARNAANQRHARKTAPRKDSFRSQTDRSDGDEGDSTDKRDQYREKNRLAAAKCRAKKKVNTESLETQARAAQGRNKRLKEEELTLRDELSFLRNCALEHLAGGCQNNQLLFYNQRKVQEAAKSAHMDFSHPSPAQPDLSPVMSVAGDRVGPGYSTFMDHALPGVSSPRDDLMKDFR